jgi:seryl-tRNA synthetase
VERNNSMSEPTGAELGTIEECEIAVFRAFDRYFEICHRELEESKERAGTEFKSFQEARRELMEAEQELEQIRQRAAELKGESLNTVSESSEVSELEEEVSELHKELGGLAEEEQRALERKTIAEERFQRTMGQDAREHLAEASNELAAVAMTKAEEINAFKERVDQYFAEGKTSILEVAI